MRRLLGLLAVLAVIGCGEDELDPCRDFDQVQTGMSEATVRDLFGPPHTFYDHDAAGTSGETAWEYSCSRGDAFVLLFSDGAVAEFGVGLPPQLPSVATGLWDWDPHTSSTEDAADITRVEIQPVGRVDNGWGYTYRFTLQSNSEFTLRVKITIEWRDASDFTLVTETVEDVLLPAGRSDLRQSGSAVISGELADRIVVPFVIWEWRGA